jgi:hypothetical protein
MREQLHRRLAELRSEFDTGQLRLTELETHRAHLKSSLLRLSGAIQVLEELLSQELADNQPEEGSEPEKLRVLATP